MNTISKHISLLGIMFLMAIVSNAQKANDHINVTNFKTYIANTKQVIEWSTDAAQPTNYWMIQCSKDGKEFTTVGLVLGADPRQEGDKYVFTQPVRPTISKNFYRLSHINKDGTEQLTEAISL